PSAPAPRWPAPTAAAPPPRPRPAGRAPRPRAPGCASGEPRTLGAAPSSRGRPKRPPPPEPDPPGERASLASSRRLFRRADEAIADAAHCLHVVTRRLQLFAQALDVGV